MQHNTTMKYHVIMTAFHHECRLKSFDDESELRLFLIDEICGDNDEDEYMEEEDEFLQMPLKDLIKLAIEAGNVRHHIHTHPSHIGTIIFGDMLGQGYV
jgi:hypothetical protein